MFSFAEGWEPIRDSASTTQCDWNFASWPCFGRFNPGCNMSMVRIVLIKYLKPPPLPSVDTTPVPCISHSFHLTVKRFNCEARTDRYTIGRVIKQQTIPHIYKGWPGYLPRPDMMVQQSVQGWARTHNLRITPVVALIQYQCLRPLSHLIWPACTLYIPEKCLPLSCYVML